jgi:hypothetical protein
MSDAPLPLSYTEAVRRATELRRRGTHWSWPTIADTMEDYHGFRRGPAWWSRQVRSFEPGTRERPRGNTFQARS